MRGINLVLFAGALLVRAAQAEPSPYFPGIEAILTQQEFHRSGLDRLNPAQLALLNDAIQRHLSSAVREEVHRQSDYIRKAAVEEERQSLLARFGLPTLSLGQEWRDEPALEGTVEAWVGGNRFRLDNGQIWEGIGPITYELQGKPIRILPRPNGQLALEVDGKSTTIRLRRVE